MAEAAAAADDQDELLSLAPVSKFDQEYAYIGHYNLVEHHCLALERVVIDITDRFFCYLEKQLGVIVVVDLPTGKLKTRIQVDGYTGNDLRPYTLVTDGLKIYFYHDYIFRVWSVGSWVRLSFSLPRGIYPQPRICGIRVPLVGDFFYLITNQDMSFIIEKATLAIAYRVRTVLDWWQFCFSPDGTQFALSDNNITIYQTRTGKKLLEIPSTDTVYKTVFSPNNRYFVYTWRNTPAIFILDRHSKKDPIPKRVLLDSVVYNPFINRNSTTVHFELMGDNTTLYEMTLETLAIRRFPTNAAHVCEALGNCYGPKDRSHLMLTIDPYTIKDLVTGKIVFKIDRQPPAQLVPLLLSLPRYPGATRQWHYSDNWRSPSGNMFIIRETETRTLLFYMYKHTLPLDMVTMVHAAKRRASRAKTQLGPGYGTLLLNIFKDLEKL